jgi:hypothetical protein
MATLDLPPIVGVRVTVPDEAGRPHPGLSDLAFGATVVVGPDELVVEVAVADPDPPQPASARTSPPRATAMIDRYRWGRRIYGSDIFSSVPPLDTRAWYRLHLLGRNGTTS